MQRIQSVGTVDALPEPEFSGRPGYFFGGDPTTGKQATVVTADWLNMVQEELLAVVTGQAWSRMPLRRIRCFRPYAPLWFPARQQS